MFARTLQHSKSGSCCVAMMLVLSTAAPVIADPRDGIAYDTVTKTVTSASPALRADDFAADVRAGEYPRDASVCTVLLIRRYVTERKERIDDACRQSATIVDCNARTATLLGLRTKTYGIVSLDAAYDDDIAAIKADSARSHVTSKITIRREALERRTIDGLSTDGYTIERTQSTFAPAPLGTITTRDRWTYYFLAQTQPVLACDDVAAPWLSRYGSPQTYDPEIQTYRDARMKRVVVDTTESGPELPPWRIPLYAVGEHFQRQSLVPDFTYFFETESGNRRSIRQDDSAFSLPPGFTNAAR